MKIRVYYEDTDTGGIVYHSKYLNFCERARSELFFQRGIMPGEGSSNGFVVHKINAGFLGSAKLGDLLEVKSRILLQRHTSLLLLQEIFKEEQKLFEMEVRLVYTEEGKISRIPDTFLEIFKNF